MSDWYWEKVLCQGKSNSAGRSELPYWGVLCRLFMYCTQENKAWYLEFLPPLYVLRARLRGIESTGPLEDSE